MNIEKIKNYRKLAQDELDRSLKFWLEHGMDPQYGGIMTFLDRKGNVYCEDKSVWMQGRCGWTFANMCNLFGERKEWLEASKSCLDFLEAHCVNREKGNRLYFITTREGQPLRQRRYHASEGFYAMANAEYAIATGDPEAKKHAIDAAKLIWDLDHGMEDPVGLGPKGIPGMRPGRVLSDPMGTIMLSTIMRRVDPENKDIYDERAQKAAEEVVKYHIKPELGCTLEFVKPDGGVYHEFCEGRRVGIGHDFESAWCLLDEAIYENNEELSKQAALMFDMAAEKGWDEKYGGLLYFIDCDGLPIEVYEHDMKLWWPHCEMLLCAMKLYCYFKDEKYFDWFEKCWDYSMKHFSDSEFGEWYGYLRREGLPTEPPTKGTLFKGPFHVPRTMSQLVVLFTELLEKNRRNEI